MLWIKLILSFIFRKTEVSKNTLKYYKKLEKKLPKRLSFEIKFDIIPMWLLNRFKPTKKNKKINKEKKNWKFLQVAMFPSKIVC